MCVEEFGISENMVVLPMPEHMKAKNGGYYTTKETILVDPCIVEEIQALWTMRVHTYGSCCGHGKIAASVLVDERSISIMEALNYGNACNPDKNLHEFLLKSEHGRATEQEEE